MKTIAIIDDNFMMREFLRQLFSKHYNVITFENGLTAMSYMSSNEQPDIIILDYQMDVMNGQQVLEEMKASDFFNEIPVMLLSGKKESETRISCLKSGAIDFVSKPFNPLELELRVQRALN